MQLTTLDTLYETTPPTTPPPAPHDWWVDAKALTVNFLEIIEKPTVGKSRPKLKELIDELEAARTQLDSMVYPEQMDRVRFYLIAALTDLKTGLSRMFSGDVGMGRAYLKAAQIETKFLETELHLQHLAL